MTIMADHYFQFWFQFFLLLIPCAITTNSIVDLFKVTKNSQCCKIMYELMFTNLNYFKLHF